MTPQELQSLRNLGDLGEDAADTIEARAERIRVLREALERMVGGVDRLPDFGRNHIALWLQLELNAARTALESTK